jgi:prephenate dehydratase
MHVAFQGEIGAFSEEAVLAVYPDATPVPMTSFEDVFAAVEVGDVDRAVIPIENSLFGSVHVNYDLLREHPVWIVGELNLRIRHHLMARADVSLPAIRRVYSHPQALGQCQTFLREQLPEAEVIPAYDTAGAAKMVAEQAAADAAAIAGEQAAAEYGLDVLAAGIESNHQNYTRFLVLAHERERGNAEALVGPVEAPFKTSVVFAFRENVPGALFKSLAVFALRELDLFKVESRPLIGSPGSYLFYLDVEGAVSDAPVQRALDHLGEITAFVKVLGSYRRGRIVEEGAKGRV